MNYINCMQTGTCDRPETVTMMGGEACGISWSVNARMATNRDDRFHKVAESIADINAVLHRLCTPNSKWVSRASSSRP